MTANLFGDRYQLGETLGFGGMSEVHRGRDLRLGRDVAIKVLRADLARDPAFQTRFQREAQNAASLNLPAIVAVYDTGEVMGETGPIPYIVMEYIDGETLRDLVKREGPLPPKRAMEIVADVCTALDYSHRHGIIHRDVKPANVMLTRGGAVKVMDFGIARAVTEGQATVTATAAVIGTAQYLSPEQARGEPVDARSDVYATGCVLYELLTGAPPFSGDSPVAVAYQHVREDPKPPSSIRTGISKELDAIVLTALNKNPMNRYQTAAEMRADLVRALAGQPIHATPVMNDDDRTALLGTGLPLAAPQPPLPPAHTPSILETPNDDSWEDDPAQKSRRVWGFVGIGLLCAALLAGAIYFTLQITSGPPSVPPVLVPSVMDMEEADAIATLEDHDLTAASPIEYAESSEEQRGLVIRQDPSSGEVVPSGSSVKLTIGVGIEQVSVPNVMGMQSDKARKAIEDANLEYSEEKVPSPTVGKDRVADQDPEPFAEVAPNSVVTVYISQGAEMTEIPSLDDLVGKQLDEAEKILEEARLKSVSQTKASEKPENEVLELGGGLLAGDQVPVDTVVTLIVSDESMMKMPDLSKYTPEEAVKILTASDVGWAGNIDFLNTVNKDDSNSAMWGLILSQIPQAGDVVPRDAMITVTIATEPSIGVPDLMGLTVKQAEKVLKDAKWGGSLTVVTENGETPPPGEGETVLKQSPTSGSSIKMTDPITIHIYPKEGSDDPPPGDEDEEDEGDGFRAPGGALWRFSSATLRQFSYF